MSIKKNVGIGTFLYNLNFYNAIFILFNQSLAGNYTFFMIFNYRIIFQIRNFEDFRQNL